VPPPTASTGRRTQLLDVELSRPIEQLPVGDWTHAQILVRLHGQPLGALELDVAGEAVSAGALEGAVNIQLRKELRDHLQQDGVQNLDQLRGLEGQRPRCLERLSVPSPPPLVTVVVPTHNRARELADCLDSVLQSSYPKFEVIVVDNAPSDDSTEAMVQESYGSDERIRYVREMRPGASLARNLGARIGRGVFVAFTDDDAQVDPLWLTGLIAGFRVGPRVVCVTGLTLPSELETPAQHAFEEYGGMGLGFVPRLYDLGPNRGDTLLYPYTAGVFGASNNVAFRREYFLRHGGFDLALGPATPAFGAEDLDLFLAVIMEGDQIAYQPTAIVRHAHRATYEELYWQVFTYSAGFTALLTKWGLRDRRVAIDLVRRVPLLLPAALLQSHRGGADAGVGHYPKQLRWLERAGYLYGPFAYLRSILSARTIKTQSFASLPAYR
jgi:glycosyltransferase involved in cell wall biosynthesis